MTRFERRVRQLEARAGGGRATIPAEWEIWIELKDGAMRGKHGEIISRKAFEQRRPFARTIVILPDNERDDLGAIQSRGDTATSNRLTPKKSAEELFNWPNLANSSRRSCPTAESCGRARFRRADQNSVARIGANGTFWQ